MRGEFAQLLRNEREQLIGSFFVIRISPGLLPAPISDDYGARLLGRAPFEFRDKPRILLLEGQCALAGMMRTVPSKCLAGSRTTSN